MLNVPLPLPPVRARLHRTIVMGVFPTDVGEREVRIRLGGEPRRGLPGAHRFLREHAPKDRGCRVSIHRMVRSPSGAPLWTTVRTFDRFGGDDPAAYDDLLSLPVGPDRRYRIVLAAAAGRGSRSSPEILHERTD